MKTMLEDAEREIWELLAEHRPDRRRILEIIERVEAQPMAEWANWAAALGYLWYLVPGEDPQRFESGVRWLQRALEDEPHHPLAHLYLGHFLYDAGELEGALQHLRAVDTEYFEHRGQQWRSLKVRELVLAALMQKGQPDPAGVIRFLADFDATAEQDRAEPTEIVAAAERTRGGPLTGSTAERVLEWARARAIT